MTIKPFLKVITFRNCSRPCCYPMTVYVRILKLPVAVHWDVLQVQYVPYNNYTDILHLILLGSNNISYWISLSHIYLPIVGTYPASNAQRHLSMSHPYKIIAIFIRVISLEPVHSYDYPSVTLTHWGQVNPYWGLVNPYGVGDLGQRWFRQWLFVWRHRAITLTNVDLSSVRSCDIHLRTLS